MLKLGGYGLLGAFADQAFWPVQARAAGKTNPRGTARFAIIIELAGAISHIDTFDFKEGEGTPKDLDVRQVRNNLYLVAPAVSRTVEGDGQDHYRALHEEPRGGAFPRAVLHAGGPPAESGAGSGDSVRSVRWSHTNSKQARRETDTFPTYIGCNLDTSGCGALSTGFLPPRHSVLDINLQAGGGATAVQGDALALLQERYRLLSELDKAMAPIARPDGIAHSPGSAASRKAHTRILGDPRWPRLFR